MNPHNFIRNPYIFGKPIYKKEELYGRENIIEAIKDNFTNNRKITLLHLQRRIGKTSLIASLPQFFTEEQNTFKFVTFSFQGYKNQSIPKILNDLAEDIAATIHGVPKQVRELADTSYNFFHLFLPTIIDEYLSDKSLVLLLDEFDVLEEDATIFDRGEKLFYELERAVKQEKKLFAILVFGRPLKDIFFLETFLQKEDRKAIEIGLLDRESTQNLIVKPAQGILEYKADAINTIWQLSAGHPSLTQLLCFFIFNYCREKGIKKVTNNHVWLILDEAMKGGEAVLNGFLEPLNNDEKLFFRAVAEAQENFEEKQLQSIIRSWQSVGKSLVEEYGFLEEREDRTGYKIKVELVRLWLLKNYPLSNQEKRLMEQNT
ncbi:MAG: ATP-binding protein [Okeania sp. SIO3I5]|uniref:ATP-binding protein n=1 Tax=Okeania sp. SIO3I5 TaxID=2607805 RepID=UPI0013B62350|nr:ATP-binding protein [Okeania sp. SIO3I5]NEQ39858.1 ATP-binding protein [Okeania sp. SIO3I5]